MFIYREFSNYYYFRVSCLLSCCCCFMFWWCAATGCCCFSSSSVTTWVHSFLPINTLLILTFPSYLVLQEINRGVRTTYFPTERRSKKEKKPSRRFKYLLIPYLVRYLPLLLLQEIFIREYINRDNNTFPSTNNKQQGKEVNYHITS